MPPVVAAVAAWTAGIVAGGVAYVTGVGSLALYGFVQSTVTYLIYSAASAALTRTFTKKPKLDQFSLDPGQITINSDGSITSHKIVYGKRRVGGQLFLRTVGNTGQDNLGNQVSGNNQFLHLGLIVAAHEIEAIDTIYFDETEITIGSNNFVTNSEYVKDGISYARIIKHLGADDQTVDPNILNEVEEWDQNGRLRGLAYIYVRFQYNENVFSSVPNVTAVIRGAKVYDPRTATTVYSDNPALCVRDYLTASYGLETPTDEIDDTFTVSAANICEEAVTIQSGGTEQRYTCNIVLDTASTLAENMQALVACMAAPFPTYSQGTFRIHAGAYDTPLPDVIDETWAAGNVNVIARPSRKDVVNTVRGVYVDSDQLYTITDFTPVTNSLYVAEDGGVPLYQDLNLAGVIGQERAQRIAKIILEKGRQGIVFSMVMNMKALQLSVWDVVKVTIEDLGWDEKVFRILQWSLSENGMGVECTFQEESSASYDWNSGEATVVDPAPDTNLPSPFDVTAPGVPSFEETLYQTIGSAGIKTKVKVSWLPSPDAFLFGYVLEYKLTTDSDYIVLPTVTVPEFTLFDVEPGLHDFRVKAVNTIGATSAYASTVYEVEGLTAPPSDIQNFSLNAINNNAHLSWDAITDLDVRTGGKILIKHTNELDSPSWSSANLIIPALDGTTNHVVAPLLNGTYMIKAQDSSGIQSVNAAFIKSTVANIVKMNQVAETIQDPDFEGDKTNLVAIDNILKFDSIALIDDILEDIDDWVGEFDSLNGSVFPSTGTYKFDNYVDVGKVVTCRVTANLEATIVDPTDLIDLRTNNIDEWSSFDGGPYSDIDVQLFIRTTEDDPSGSPTWSEWRQFLVGDYTTRAFEFEIEVTSRNTALNIEISILRATIDMPDVIDHGNITTSAIGAVTVNFNQTYFTAPYVGVTINDADDDDSILKENVTATSFDLSVTNGGTRVVRNCTWNAGGY